MTDRLRKRVDAIEQRQSAQAGGLNLRLAIVPRGMTADQRRQWRAEQDAQPGRTLVLHVIPWPPCSLSDLDECLEAEAIEPGMMAAAVREMGDPQATAAYHRHVDTRS